MNTNAKKIVFAAQVEGEESQWYVKCDLDNSTGHSMAVLFWPSSSDMRHAYHRLEPSDLSPSSDEGIDYIYTGNPIPIPKILAEMNPEPLSDDAFRLGFFRIE